MTAFPRLHHLSAPAGVCILHSHGLTVVAVASASSAKRVDPLRLCNPCLSSIFRRGQDDCPRKIDRVESVHQQRIYGGQKMVFSKVRSVAYMESRSSGSFLILCRCQLPQSAVRTSMHIGSLPRRPQTPCTWLQIPHDSRLWNDCDVLEMHSRKAGIPGWGFRCGEWLQGLLRC